VLDLLAEGIESIKLACSLVLLVPALGVLLMGRRRRWLVPVWILAVTLIAWLRFTGWWTPFPGGALHIASGVILVAFGVVAWRQNKLAYDLTAIIGAAFLAGWTWVPCVGRELGDILNNARQQPWSELGPTFVFMTGLFVPLILIAALEIAWPRFGKLIEEPRLRAAGLAIIVFVGALVAVTLFDNLAGELARRSSF